MENNEGLNRLYNTGFWIMRPDDEKGIERFNEILKIFEEAIKSYTPFKSLLRENKIKILDLAGGTGIAGVALAKTLFDNGINSILTVIDARIDDLKYVEKWVEHCNLLGKLSFRFINGDVRHIDTLVKENYDIALIWGSSMPHFSVNDYLMILSGLSQRSSEKSLLWIEQGDLIGKIMLNNQYLNTIFTLLNDNGEGIINLHASYDPIKGVVKRCYYKVPSFQFIGCIQTRYWDVSSLMGYAKIFYKTVMFYKPSFTTKWYRGGFIAWEPRKIGLSPKDFQE